MNFFHKICNHSIWIDLITPFRLILLNKEPSLYFLDSKKFNSMFERDFLAGFDD